MTYHADTGVLQINLEVAADTLRGASDEAQTAAGVTGLLKPTRLSSIFSDPVLHQPDENPAVAGQVA